MAGPILSSAHPNKSHSSKNPQPSILSIDHQSILISKPTLPGIASLLALGAQDPHHLSRQSTTPTTSDPIAHLLPSISSSKAQQQQSHLKSSHQSIKDAQHLLHHQPSSSSSSSSETSSSSSPSSSSSAPKPNPMAILHEPDSDHHTNQNHTRSSASSPHPLRSSTSSLTTQQSHPIISPDQFLNDRSSYLISPTSTITASPLHSRINQIINYDTSHAQFSSSHHSRKLSNASTTSSTSFPSDSDPFTNEFDHSLSLSSSNPTTSILNQPDPSSFRSNPSHLLHSRSTQSLRNQLELHRPRIEINSTLPIPSTSTSTSSSSTITPTNTITNTTLTAHRMAHHHPESQNSQPDPSSHPSTSIQGTSSYFNHSIDPHTTDLETPTTPRRHHYQETENQINKHNQSNPGGPRGSYHLLHHPEISSARLPTLATDQTQIRTTMISSSTSNSPFTFSSSGINRYQCNEIGCGKTFSRPSSLKIHSYSHTGQKPFKCFRCDRAFSVQSNLKRHQKVHERKNGRGCSSRSESSITHFSNQHQFINSNLTPDSGNSSSVGGGGGADSEEMEED